MIPGPIVGIQDKIDRELPAEVVEEDKLITNDHYLSGFNKEAQIPIIHIFDKNDKNWALVPSLARDALQEGQMLTLTLNTEGTAYVPKFTKISDTFEEVRLGLTARDKELNNAIYNNKGLFGEIEDLNVFVQAVWYLKAGINPRGRNIHTE